MPKLRVVFVMPLYAVDFLILYLLITSLSNRSLRYKGYAQLIVKIVSAYLFFVILGELRGGVVYWHLLDALYMLFRFMMAFALFYLVPKWIVSPRELIVVIKALCAGLLLSAIISVLFSLPFTRNLVVNSVFAIKALNPIDMTWTLENSATIRGNTLIGTSTFSSGVMAILWPLLFMGGVLFKGNFFWKKVNLGAIFVVPIGILATYGRSAWASVILVVASILVWGGKSGKSVVLLWLLIIGLVVVKIGLESNIFMVDRVVESTKIAVENPLDRSNERERFMAYVEPFQHVLKYPSFLLMGSGAANRKFGGDDFGEESAASHAVSGMAYMAYGVGGAVCQILLMIFSFKLVFLRFRKAKRYAPATVWMWQALLAAWFGLLPWWLFGHGIVTQPRGAMVFFMFLGIIMACERMWQKVLSNNRF